MNLAKIKNLEQSRSDSKPDTLLPQYYLFILICANIPWKLLTAWSQYPHTELKHSEPTHLKSDNKNFNFIPIIFFYL